MASKESFSSSNRTVQRTSIHTPLKPASVQDLKAKFDASKTDGNTSGSGNTSPRSPLSDRKGEKRSSFGKGGVSTTGTKSSASGVTLSSVSSALHSAAQRRVEAGSVSSSSTSSSSSSSLSSKSKTTSSLAQTTARSYSTSSNATKSSSSPSSTKSTTVSNFKSTSSAKTPGLSQRTGSSSGSNKTDDIRSSFEKDSEGRIEIPVMHITGNGSDVKVVTKTSPRGSNLVDNRLRKNGGDRNLKNDDSNGPESKVGNIKSTFDGSGGSPKATPRGLKMSDKVGSPPVQRTNRLVAREITIERLDSGVCVTSYKDQKIPSTSKTTSSNAVVKTQSTTSAVGNRVGQIKVGSVTSTTTTPSENSDKAKEDLPFRQIKLRNTKEQIERQVSRDKITTNSKSSDPNASRDKITNSKSSKPPASRDKTTTSAKSSELQPNDDVDIKRLSRKMSTERFERLKFDFERGVPTEYSPRKDSGDSDHITLQQKAREFNAKLEVDDVPIITKATKEESIFTEGLKVSDFVKQVNKMNPDLETKPKWKVQKRNSQTSSVASSDVGGEISSDCYYEGIPGEDLEDDTTTTYDDGDDDDDIYEKVSPTFREPEPEQDGIDTGKTPGRRLGIYRKQKGGKKRREEIASNQSKHTEDSDQEVVIHSDGENGWEDGAGSSSGTDYEEFGQDYDEGGETYADLEAFTKQAEQGGGNVKNKTLSHKLKKIFVNSKGNKNKKKKTKTATELASVATDSDGEILDGSDEAESETLSRTGSERGSGRFIRNDSNHNQTNPSTSTSTENNASTTTCTTGGINSKDGNTMSSNTVIITESSSDDTVSPPVPGQSSSSSHGAPPPPPLPPRSSRNLTQVAENSPPLPPRNATLSGKSTLGISLDTVIPVSPTSKRHSYGADKYKDRFSFNSQDGSDSGCSTGKLEYIDYDPASAQSLERNEKAECKRRKSLFGRRSNISTSSRPTSSASNASSYMYPDISAFPELQGQDDDSLYVDLEDEQIYGKASDIYISKFESEPLYQWYSKDKMIQNNRVSKGLSSGDLSDEEYLELEKDASDPNSVYEDVERLLEDTAGSHASKPPGSGSSSSNISNSSQEELRKEPIIDRPQRRSVIEDVFKNGGNLHRALWCQMPEVIKSGILQELTDQEKKIQEAMFEIMTSEASYLKSLKILLNVFVSAPEFAADHLDRCVITRRDRIILFSNIGSIKDISSNFLSDLESRWQESILQKDVCDIIVRHAKKNFEPYVRYCRNQAFQDRALNTLKQNAEFSEAVKRLEQNPNCQFLPLASFLLLPMQRITRLPLLVDAICHRLEPGTPQHKSARKAFESLTKVAKHCDEAAKKIQQAEQMCLLASNLEFKIKEFPILSASRFLVKQGELTLIKGEGTTRKPLSKLLGSNKEHFYLFLFNDLLLLTKKKGHTYSVRDYCQRNSLHMEPIDNPDKSRHIAPGVATGMINLLFLAMLANHDNKQVELVLACKSESERSRWIDAIMPTQSNTDTERIYDVWDCPQLQCVRKYLATQPDELTLEESDVVNVTKKLADGWCMGERIRDGEKGWFPASYTEEINNSHVRARNLKLRYRLMMASEEYSQMELVKDKR